MKSYILIGLLLAVQSVDITSQKLSQAETKDFFDGVLSNGNSLKAIHEFQAEIDQNKINAEKRAAAEAEAKENEKDPSGSMKLKREKDAEAKKLGISKDDE